MAKKKETGKPAPYSNPTIPPMGAPLNGQPGGFNPAPMGPQPGMMGQPMGVQPQDIDQ